MNEPYIQVLILRWSKDTFGSHCILLLKLLLHLLFILFLTWYRSNTAVTDYILVPSPFRPKWIVWSTCELRSKQTYGFFWLWFRFTRLFRLSKCERKRLASSVWMSAYIKPIVWFDLQVKTVAFIVHILHEYIEDECIPNAQSWIVQCDPFWMLHYYIG